jgi:hypothetical protein
MIRCSAFNPLIACVLRHLFGSQIKTFCIFVYVPAYVFPEGEMPQLSGLESQVTVFGGTATPTARQITEAGSGFGGADPHRVFSGLRSPDVPTIVT